MFPFVLYKQQSSYVCGWKLVWKTSICLQRCFLFLFSFIFLSLLFLTWCLCFFGFPLFLESTFTFMFSFLWHSFYVYPAFSFFRIRLVGVSILWYKRLLWCPPPRDFEICFNQLYQWIFCFLPGKKWNYFSRQQFCPFLILKVKSYFFLVCKWRSPCLYQSGTFQKT